MCKNDRVGEVRKMNNGLNATIIEYHSYPNVDIQFENGQKVYRRAYNWFLQGKIKCPMIIEYIEDYARVTNANVNPHAVFLIDKEDIPLLGDKYWCVGTSGYIVNKSGKKLHRLVICANNGEIVDQENGNCADNRKRNLRKCNQAQNSQNQKTHSNNKSGYKGVWRHSKNPKWIAGITVNYKLIHLGSFDDKIEAAKAYNIAAIEHFGEFAKLNIF